jgi:hypothetical protein
VTKTVLALVLFSLATSAGAERIGFGPPAAVDSDSVSYVTIKGQIESGDDLKLLQLIRANPIAFYRASTVFVDSPGGDVRAAVGMASILRDSRYHLTVEGTCASACFFLYAAAERRGVARGRVGIHRPVFDDRFYDRSPSASVRSESRTVREVVDAFLAEYDVPNALRERMFATPSTSMYWLSDRDIENLGSQAAWAQEQERARCGPRDRHASQKAIVQQLLCLASYEDSDREHWLNGLLKDTSPAWNAFVKGRQPMRFR